MVTGDWVAAAVLVLMVAGAGWMLIQDHVYRVMARRYDDDGMQR